MRTYKSDSCGFALLMTASVSACAVRNPRSPKLSGSRCLCAPAASSEAPPQREPGKSCAYYC
jgi:hypothetical protein